MANVLGTLLVELGVNTAAFSNGLSKATYQAKAGAQQIATSLRGIGGVLSELGSSFGTFGSIVGQSLGTAGSAVGQMVKNITSGGGLAGAMGIAVAGAVGFGAALATAGAAVVGIAIHTASGAAKLYELSQSTGVAIQTLSGLSVIGKLVGVDMETLAKGLERMDKSALRAAQSPNAVSNGYRQLGINVLNANGTMKQTSELFGEVADKFAEMEDGSQKTAISMLIFGRAGANLIPVLNKGSEAMKYWIDYGTKVGAVLDEKASAGAHNFEEQMTKLGLISEGVQNKLMTALLPAIDHIVVAITSFVEKGDTIEQFGKIVGSVLVALTKIVFEAAYSFEWWKGKLSEFKAVWDSTVVVTLKGISIKYAPGEGIDEVATKAESDIQKAKDRLAIELADLESISVTPAGPGEGKRNKKQAAISQPEAAVKPEPNLIADFVTKTELATAAEVDLAGAIGQTAGNMLLQKAASEAAVKIGDINTKIMDRLVILEEEEAQAVKAGVTAKVAAIRHQEDALRGQLEVLDASRGKLVALFETKAVATFAAEIGKSFTDANEKLALTVAGMKALSEAEMQGGEALVAAKIEEKLAGDKAKVQELGDALNNLSDDQKADSAVVEKLMNDYLMAGEQVDIHRRLLQQENDATYIAAAAKYNLAAALATDELQFNKEAAAIQANTKATNEQKESMLLLLAAARQSKENALTKQWDDAALSVGTFGEKARAVLNELNIENQNVGKNIAGAFKTFFDGVSTQFADMVTKGKFSFTSLFDSLENAIIKQLASSALNDLIQKLGSLGQTKSENNFLDTGSTGGGGGFLGFLGGLFGGGKALGGNVNPGTTYLVGERGPELFSPSMPGAIGPTSGSGGGAMHANITMHVHGATDPDSFKKSSSQLAAEMYRQLSMAHAHNGGENF